MKFTIFFNALVILICISCDNQNRVQDTDQGISLTTHQRVSPVLIGKSENPVLRIAVEADSSGQPQTVSRISVNTKGTTNTGDIKEVSLFYTGADSSFNAGRAFGEPQQTGVTLQFSDEQPLQPGTNYYWVSYTLNSGNDLLNRVDAGLDAIMLADGSQVRPANDSPEGVKRIGIALRQPGDDEVASYRIPGLVTTNEGTLIAAYDIRYEDAGDLQGNIDVGISRSTDGGRSWEPMQVIMDMDEWGGLSEDQNGVGDPSILVDDQTGTIWVAGLWTHGMPGQRAWNASSAGLEPSETGQFVLVKSEDDGKTWSDPINITEQIKNREWQLLLQGPGKGITMSNGTLVFPAQFKDENNIPHSTIVYSKDHGESWDIGTGAKPNTTEAQVVELSDGSLMLNMRDNRGGSRSVYTTDDLGQTWDKHPTSRDALIEPISQASIIQFPASEGATDEWLLFSNPHNTEDRRDMTIQLSTDDGMSWPEDQQILLNEKPGFGYSCMTVVNDSTVGILYEGTSELFFQKVLISDLLNE